MINLSSEQINILLWKYSTYKIGLKWSCFFTTIFLFYKISQIISFSGWAVIIILEFKYFKI